MQIIKLKESIEKLKKQNKKLLNDKLRLEEVMNQTIGTPKPAYTNYISTSQKALKGKISIIVYFLTVIPKDPNSRRYFQAENSPNYFKNDFLTKHNLRPMNNKNSRNIYNETKPQHQRNNSNLKSMKSL